MVAALLRAVVAPSLIFFVHSQQFLPFESFIELHGRSYRRNSAEFSERKGLYEQRVAQSKLQNSVPDRLWTAGVNKLSDWTEAELQSLRGWDGSMRPQGSSSRSVQRHQAFLQQHRELPEEKIWSNLAMAQHAKNQGGCGSCWALAAATVLEAHVEIYSGKPRTFSAQQIVACTPNPKHCGGDGGCKGATAELAMEWVLKNGCAEESVVPYTASDGNCTLGSPTLDMAQLFKRDSISPTSLSAGSGGASFGMTGWETLPLNQYEPLLRALAEKGPVAVSAAACFWFSYQSGIFNGCPKDAVIDHAVVAIGYGVQNNTKYWVIQNSWGEDWGDNGLIRLERHDKGDYCGMNADPQKGVACKGETAPVPVCGMCGILFDSVLPHFR